MGMSHGGLTTLVLTGLCVFITGSSGAGCTTSLTSLDLGCLLQWDCPKANANTTTYTVQTMTQGGKSCCPVSELIDPWVTVTVHNQQNSSDYKMHTGWAQEVVYEAVFQDLVPGQDYCVVANFSFGPPSFPQSWSPLSEPRCVHKTAPRLGPGLKPVIVGIGVCLLLFLSLPAFVLYLLKQKLETPPTNKLPKSLATLQESFQDPPQSSSDPIDPSDIQVEVNDHLSILSSFSSGVYTEAQAPSLGDGYSSNLFPSDYKSGNMHWDTGGMELGLNFGRTLTLPCSPVTLGLPKCSLDSPVQPHLDLTVSALASQASTEGCAEGRGVPLCSVRFGEAEDGEKLEAL